MALIVSATVALGACGSAPFTVGVALDGALGDNAFNDGAAAGLARVESEFGYETVLQELDGDAIGEGNRAQARQPIGAKQFVSCGAHVTACPER